MSIYFEDISFKSKFCSILHSVQSAQRKYKRRLNRQGDKYQHVFYREKSQCEIACQRIIPAGVFIQKN